MKIKINDSVVEINAIQTDSRKIKNGDMFIAYSGVSVDGHDFINQAIKNGAKVIVGEKEISSLAVPYFSVPDGRAFWTDACAQQYDNPQTKLKIIGITGTDGKTTTSNFIYEILRANNYKVALISTVNAKFGDITLDTGLHTSTPDPDILFRIMRDLLDAGAEYLVLEVTSHAITLKKIKNIKFVCAGLTNITPEHLDFHETYEELVKTKCKLFEQSKTNFINSHSKISESIEKYIYAKIHYTKYDDVLIKKLGDAFSQKFPGLYNLENAALALAITQSLGCAESSAILALQNATEIIGRFNKIENSKQLNIIVDFAHTENAMRNVLGAVRNLMKGDEKLITVFGCAGLRDTQKRPAMGKTASEFSDKVIITSEDPRTEDPKKIIEEVANGNSQFDFIKIVDRKSAIQKALEIANKNDWILILGKGHEQSMNIDGIEHEWSDTNVVGSILDSSLTTASGGD